MKTFKMKVSPPLACNRDAAFVGEGGGTWELKTREPPSPAGARHRHCA